jgi:hypothetical protein
MRRLIFAALAAFALVCPANAEEIGDTYVFLPSFQVTVGTSATLLSGSSKASEIEVCNEDTAKTLRVSFSSTMTTGRPVYPQLCVQFTQMTGGQRLYGLTSSGTLVATVTEVLPYGR